MHFSFICVVFFSHFVYTNDKYSSLCFLFFTLLVKQDGAGYPTKAHNNLRAAAAFGIISSFLFALSTFFSYRQNVAEERKPIG